MIRMSLSGTSLADQAALMQTLLGQATSAAMAGAVEGAKQDLRRQMSNSGYQFGRAVNALRGEVYPKAPRWSHDPAGTVYAAGDSADRFLSAFATGAVITPNKKRALAVPLHDFRGWDRRLIGPKSSFWGGKLIFLPSRNLATSIGILASERDKFATGRRFSNNTPLRRYHAAGLSDADRNRLIPQFVLLAWVQAPNLLTPDETLNAWSDRLPDLIADALSILDK